MIKYGANQTLLLKENYVLTKQDVLDIQDIHYQGDYVTVSGRTREHLIDKDVFKIGNIKNYSQYVDNGYRNTPKYAIISSRIEDNLKYILKVLDLLSYIYLEPTTEIALFTDVKIIGKKEPYSFTQLFLVTDEEEREVTLNDIYLFFITNIKEKEKVEKTDFFIK